MRSFVITASVYVEPVHSLEEATEAVEALNEAVGREPIGTGASVHIRLPDSANDPDSMDSHWE